MRIKKICISFILSFLTALCISGCSGNFSSIVVDTNLTCTKLFAGTREMVITIPAGVYSSIFKKDADKINEVLDAAYPEGVTGSCVSEDGKTAVITVDIDFDTWVVYRKILGNIFDASTKEITTNPIVNYDYAKTILKDGYTLEENFTSRDLLGWMYDAFYDAYPKMEKTTFEDFFSLGTTEVTFDNNQFDMSQTGMVQISDIKSKAFEAMDINVDIDDDEYDCQITYKVNNKVVASLGKKLTTLMNSLVPDGGELTYTDEANIRVYELSFSAEDADELKLYMNKALCSSDTEFEVSAEGDADSLSAKKSVIAYFDCGFFLDFTDEDTELTYCFTVPSDYTVDSCEGTYGYLENDSSSYSSDDCQIKMKLANSDEISMVLGFAVDIDSVQVNTQIFNDENIERQVVLKISNDADALVGDSLNERFDALSDAYPDQDKVTVSKDELISSMTYTVDYQADSVEELNAMTQCLFGEDSTDDNDTTLAVSQFTGGSDKKQNPWHLSYTVEDTLNLSEFLKGSQITNGIVYSISYPKGYKASFQEGSTFEESESSKETVSCTTYDKILSVKTCAEKINLEGIIVVILWVVSFVVIALVVFFKFGLFYKLIREKKFDMPGESLFEGWNLRMLIGCSVAVVIFVLMTIRLLFKVY